MAPETYIAGTLPGWFVLAAALSPVLFAALVVGVVTGGDRRALLAVPALYLLALLMMGAMAGIYLLLTSPGGAIAALLLMAAVPGLYFFRAYCAGVLRGPG